MTRIEIAARELWGENAVVTQDCWDKWNACRCGSLPIALDAAVFAEAMAHGEKAAVRVLQEMTVTPTHGFADDNTIHQAHAYRLRHGTEGAVAEYKAAAGRAVHH